MSYVAYEQYTALGYSDVPEAAFPRWAIMAEQVVRKHTFDRITDANITDVNRIGVCEIINALYKQNQTLSSGENGEIVKSFSNQKYSESYASAEETHAATDRIISRILTDYFTPEQLNRWI